jgi:LysM repeat protein
MKPKFSIFLFSLLAVIVLTGTLPAQDDIRVRVANLTQDVARLTEELNRLRLDMEEMKRENTRLATAVRNAISASENQQSVLTAVDRRLAELRSDFTSAQQAQRREIIAEISRQIDNLARQTQTTIDALARAVNSQPAPPAAQPTFSEDYPRTGVVYTVQPGDTLSGIAQRHGSNVRDIMNANRIARPQNLRAGETIFIPIPE